MKSRYVLFSFNQKKLIIFSAILWLVGLQSLTAQNVNVSATGGVNNTYLTLKEAFDQINLGTHTGVITCSIVGNTTETVTAALNASGGTSSFSSVTISPSGGAARTITGSIAGHLIDLNGADNVLIDGLNSSGNSLTISNTSTSTSASTIRFIADAINNTVTRATILGSTGSALSSGFGVIFFSTGTTTGNDGNTISNCDISAAGTNLPINGIFSQGSSASIDNSGISILNNNISNFFNTNSASNGIHMNLGTSGWTVTGNSIYQVGTRTYSTANTHNAIVSTNGSGYIISNNFIGGSAPSAGGSAYTMAGTIATRFIGINLSAGTTTTVNSVQGNTISNIQLNTSSGAATTNGILCGINVTAGNANIGTTTGNTIGATSGVDNIRAISTTVSGLLVGIHSSSTGTIAIQNNRMGGLSSSGITAAVAGSVSGVSISTAPTSVNISNNVIGNATANNMRGGTLGLTTGSSLVVGINLIATPNTATINGNKIQNLSSFGTNTAGFVRGIQTATSASTTATGWSISNDTITNLTTNSTFVGFGSGLCSALGIHHLATQGCTISQNIVSNISNVNTTATTNIIVAGIVTANAAVTTSLTTTVSRNRVWGLSNLTVGTTALTPPIVTGIAVRSGNNIIAINNNMVALGNSQTTNTSFIGIWCQNGSAPNPTTMNVYHNSVVIEGSVTAGALPSFSFMRSIYITTGSNTVTLDLKNNIFQNSRSGGTGQHFAISNGFNVTPTVSALGWTSNNNVLNANPATIGHWTSAQSFVGWQTISAGDGFSLSGVSVPFVNTALGDLRVNYGLTPTGVESGGSVVGITGDIDNDLRPGPAGSVNGAGFAPDLGADEFDGVYVDVIKPVITYSPLSFTCASTARTLIATITDLSGVPTSGAGLPVLYWTINGVPSPPATATSLGGNQYSFTFGAGVVTGDVVGYYIVAQDLAPTPNIAASPALGAAGFTINPPAVSTAPSTPSTYNIAAILPPGTYTVGVAGTYPTLTAAIAVYNTRCLAGPIVFELLDATYTEAGAMTTIKHPDASMTNSLTIKPASGVTASVSASVASGALLKILGNFVTIDGSNNGTTTRDLTLTNTNTTGPTVIHIGSTGTSPITNVTIKNSIILNGATTASAIVTSDGAALGSAGFFNNITIQNNSIQRAFIGSFNIAVVSPGNGSGLLLTQNSLNTSGANSIRLVGLYVQGTDGATISNNTVGNFSAADAENDTGIWMATGASNTTVSGNTVTTLGMISSTTAFAPFGIRESTGLVASGNLISGNTITNLSSNGSDLSTTVTVFGIDNSSGGTIIEKNNVSNINQVNTGTFGAVGINVSAGSNTIIRNNFVSNVSQVMTGGFSFDTNFGVFGIKISGGGSGHAVYHNSVHLNGLLPGTAASNLLSAAFAIASTASTGCDVRNNIFANTTSGGTTNIAHVSVFLPGGGTSAMNLNLNNNAYYHGTDAARQGIGQAGTTPGVNFFTNLITQGGYTTTLRSPNTNDQNSYSFNTAVPFVSATDLHIVPAVGYPVNAAGAPIVSVTSDIDGVDIRDGATPDLGADEITLPCTTVVTNNGNNVNTLGTLRNALTCVADGGTITFDPGVPTSFITEPLWIKKNVTLKGVAAVDFDFSNVALSSSTYGLRIGAGKTVILDDINLVDKNNPDAVTPSLVPLIEVVTGLPGGILRSIGATTISKL